MGTLVSFPERRRITRDAQANNGHRGSATIIILPVIRIERYGEDPSEGVSAGHVAAGRKRRRRATRS